jgi:hypothetical protein
MATNVRNSMLDNSAKDNTGDAINGSEVDSNPNSISDILDGTTGVTMGGAAQTVWGYGAIFNEDSNDSDFRIETNNVANGFVVNAGLDTFGFGIDGQDDQFMTISPPAASHTATTNTYNLHVTSGGAQTIPSGTTTYVGTVNIEEPNITATGTVTNAFSVRIANAPTEGSNNYALWVDAGTTRLDGLVDIDGSIDADVSDVDVTSSGDIDLTSTNDAASAIYLRANGGTSETIAIHADQGTSVTEGASSVQILSDAGGVELKSTANLAKSVKLIADGGASETIYIQADQGTSESSIQLLSDAGGIDIDAAADKDVDIAGGQINLTSSHNTGSAIYLRANAGTTETIKIHADQGSGTGSITVVSDAGGIDIDAAGAIAVDSSGAGISLDAGGASNFTTTAGALTLTSAAAATWSTAAGALTVNGTAGVNIQEGGANVMAVSDAKLITFPLVAYTAPVVLGHTARDNTIFGESPMLQVIGTGSAGAGSIALIRYEDATDGPWLNFCRSDHDDIGTHALVDDGDQLGVISWQPSDGNDFQNQSAYIMAKVDGTGGNNEVPGSLNFGTTADGAVSSTLQMKIASDGGVFLYNLLAAGESTVLNINGSDELHSQTSSRVYKEDEKNLEIDTSRIYDLNVKSFSWAENSGSYGMRDFGLIAEDAYEAMPEVVNLRHGHGPYSIRNSALTIAMLNEVQKLKKEIDTIKEAA